MRRLGVSGVAVIAALLLSVPSATGAARAQISQVGPAPATERLELVLPLVADEAGLQRFARQVSTPGSPSYGQYEPLSTLASRFGASSHIRAQVLAFLRRAGATSVQIDRTRLFAYATLKAAVAQRLFGARLSQFRSARGARFVAPTKATSIPAGLKGAITGVVGLDTRPLASAHQTVTTSAAARASASAAHPTSALPRTGSVSPSACAAGSLAGSVGGDPTTAGFAPNQYLTAYGFDPLHSAGFRGQGERVALIEINGFRYSDLKAFATCFGFDIPRVNGFGVGSVHHELAPGGEATLDLEVLDAAAPDLTAIDVYESKPSASEVLRALVSPLQNRGFRPQVISASLGLCESALVGALGSAGIRASESALAMATATGISFLASSGDLGSADCAGLNGLPLPRLAVNYPASSWWVTGVGGTNFTLDAANRITSQLVWNDIGIQPDSAGGGGASILFGRPSYQKGTVAANRRAVPDVSMLADVIPGYAIYCTPSPDCDPTNPWTAVGGTSAGTPLLAGGLALIDQELRTQKRADLGLVNPLLYQVGRSTLASAVFSDVLKYDNDVGPDGHGIGHPLGCCSAGPGFDEASGWGSVNLTGLAVEALKTQPSRQSLSIPAHQHPVSAHKLMAKVTCVLGCRAAAAALIKVGSARPFEVDSRPATLVAGATKTFTISFTPGQLRKLRDGLRHRRTIRAQVTAVQLDAHDHVELQTPPQLITIKS